MTATGLAPMTVAPAWQRRVVGARLITEGLDRFRASGYPMVVVLGRPNHYSNSAGPSTQSPRIDHPRALVSCAA